MSHQDSLVLGIDVGTGSVRAGLFTGDGVLAARGEHPIQLMRSTDDRAEQSSDDIWRAAGLAVRAALAGAGADSRAVAGIGFDATCSLVAVGADGRGVGIGPERDDTRDVVVWMDHRATRDASEIDATRHPVLEFVGGSISPEMQTPKLRWLQRELPDVWARVTRWFDLADYLTWRATGSDVRSLCTTTCKWTYLAHERRWDPTYFELVGLGELAADGFARIGAQVRGPGERVGTLHADAARDLGLEAGTAVGVSLIDAHAGALGMLGVPGVDVALEARLAVIAGTSACHLAVSQERVDVAGVWGPYFDVLLPDRWLTEAGISASGAFLEQAVLMHPASRRLGADPLTELDGILTSAGADAMAATASRHWQPSVLGNRAPLADPELTGALAGVQLRDDLDDLAAWYLAALQALAYATRHIVDTLVAAGKAVELLVCCGGSATNDRWLQTHADALGIPVATPGEPDAVLLGAAMLGATAAGVQPSLLDAMSAMTRTGTVVAPDPATRRFHDAKYAVYRRMLEDSLAYRALMLDH